MNMNSWTIAGVVVGVISVVVAIIFGVLQLRGRRSSAGEGGKGGNATVRGKSSTAIGGRGGGGGVGGRGGAGGDATVTGDNAFALGGEGGEAGQADRGGRGGRSPLEVLEEMGLGDDTSRFMLLYGKLGQEYAASHGGVSPNPLPEEWVNERLQELGHPWGVKNTASGFELVFHASRLVDITWSFDHPEERAFFLAMSGGGGKESRVVSFQATGRNNL